MRLSELAGKLEVELRPAQEGDPNLEIAGVASFARASAGDLVFAENEAALSGALASRAGAVIVARGIEVNAACAKPLLIARDAKLGFALAARLLARKDRQRGIHATAEIDPSAVLGNDVAVGAFAVVSAGVEVGEGSSIGEGAVVGSGVRLGAGCRIYPRVVLYSGTVLGQRVVVHAGAVLGADGFGYVRDAKSGAYVQFPQQGILVIEDDVEIGAGATIDRGALEETRIGRGTKIDNLVHIGHNVRVGSDVVMAAQTGVSGSCVIGDGAVLGGQVGLGDHVSVGAGVIVGAQAGVLPHKQLKGPGMLFWGTPAKPVKTYLRELATLARLVRSSNK
jgi:UDP-3-O-[3-hydroxymyristoyl] glucosamine N-acyltransferase